MVAPDPNTLHGPLLLGRFDRSFRSGNRRRGATTWERACLGLPSLVVAIAANQLPFSEALAQAGHVQLLGDEASVTAEKIRSALRSLIAQPLAREAANALTDGWGASRLAMAMLGYQGAISLRPATAADEALLLYWANDPEVRANSFSQEPIALKDHNHWFHKGLTDANRLLLIATTADLCPIGQIRFDRQPASAQADASEATVELSLDRFTSRNGLVADLVRLGLQLLEQRWGPAPDHNEVLPDNITIHMFARAAGNSELFSVRPQPRAVNRWRCTGRITQ